MHAIFMPYGKRSEVELLLRDMEAQKHKLKMWLGKETKTIYIQGQVRMLPFGVYEYVFPKEDMDCVLHTLDFDSDRYSLGYMILTFIRKMIHCDKIPEYKKDKNYLWVKEFVNIIPLGIREDGTITDEDGLYIGWTHEAI